MLTASRSQLGQLLAQLEDLVGLAHRRHAGLGQHQAAPGRLEQRVAQRALQLAHLGAHRLHRHVRAAAAAREMPPSLATTQK